MDKIIYKRCELEKELAGILKLQEINHFSSLSTEELTAEGFLTCTHDLELLKTFNEIAPHIIAVYKTEVIGYLLTMTESAEEQMPFLKPMFNEFRSFNFLGKPVAAYNYLIVGQVCVGRGFRGKGVLERLYNLYTDTYNKRFDFAITEIATRNIRSIKAHKKNGFKEIHTYYSPDGEEWSIVILDWSSRS